jgi:hypothetical protein
MVEQQKIEVFERVNRVKIRMGLNPKDTRMGALDPLNIKKAASFLAQETNHYTKVIETALVQLNRQWDVFKMGDRSDHSREILFLAAHELKDIAGFSGHHAICAFSESLRDYIEETIFDKEEHLVIAEAYINMIKLSLVKNIQDTQAPEFKEIRTMLQTAIEKYADPAHDRELIDN